MGDVITQKADGERASARVDANTRCCMQREHMEADKVSGFEFPAENRWVPVFKR